MTVVKMTVVKMMVVKMTVVRMTVVKMTVVQTTVAQTVVVQTTVVQMTVVQMSVTKMPVPPSNTSLAQCELAIFIKQLPEGLLRSSACFMVGVTNFEPLYLCNFWMKFYCYMFHPDNKGVKNY